MTRPDAVAISTLALMAGLAVGCGGRGTVRSDGPAAATPGATSRR